MLEGLRYAERFGLFRESEKHRNGGIVKKSKHASKLIVCFLTVLSIVTMFSVFSYAQPTTIKIKAVTGIWYTVDWVEVNYTDIRGTSQRIRRDTDINLGQEATITVPEGATNIRLDAKPRGSFSNTRIFNNLSLAGGRDHCFELRGAVNSPSYTRVTCSWVPAGRISVYDNVLKSRVGLKRVMVEINNRSGTSTIGTTYTDDSGNFSLNRAVTGPVRYKLVFKDAAGLRVKWGANSHAESVGFQAREEPLVHTFMEADKNNWYWATIYNACQFYKDYAAQDGIPVKSDAQICGYYESGTSTTPMTGIQDIIFKLFGRNSENIFSVVMHEMAHMTHAQVDRNGYASFVGSWGLVNTLRAAFGESWACGPQAIYTNRRYRPNDNELNSYQNFSLADYTYAPRTVTGGDRGKHLYIHPIVVDLMDSFNQRSKSNEYPLDRVSGYTLRQIAYALKGAHNLDNWKNNLKRINNPTSAYLDEYFDQYFEDRAVSTPTNTIIKIKAVTGIGYTVDWVEVNYTDQSGRNQTIRRDRDINLGQEATITVPDGATNIRIEAKPRASLGNTRIFNNLSLTSGQSHCFNLTGTVNRPRYQRVSCGS